MEKKGRVEGSMAGSSGNSLSKRDSNEETIRHFRVSNDKLPLTFRLLRVQGLPQWANTSCVSIGDVIQVQILLLFLKGDATCSLSNIVVALSVSWVVLMFFVFCCLYDWVNLHICSMCRIGMQNSRRCGIGDQLIIVF